MAKKQKLPGEPAHAGQLPEVVQIDLGAALPAQVPGAQPPRRGRGRPRKPITPSPLKPKPRKTRKDKGITKTPKSPIIDNNIMLVNNKKIIGEDDIGNRDNREFSLARELKSKITPKEARFLEIYLSGEHSQVSALKLAGYEGYNERYLEELARKIIGKVESQTEDRQILARAMGAGEIFIIKTLYSLAKNSKSEKIRGENAMNLAKIMGLTKDQLEGAGGLTIIFEGPGAPGATASLPGAPLPPSQGEIKVIPASNKPIMITK